MKQKIISAVLCTSVVASLLAGCGLTPPPVEETTEEEVVVEDNIDYEVNEAAAADPHVSLRMAEVNSVDGTICGAMDTKFKEAVEAMSGGSITIDLQGSGVLGVEADILDGMLGGAGLVDVARISAFALSNYGAEKSVLLSLPYTFEDRDHFWNFATSELGQEFLNEPHEKGMGVRGLYFGEEGFRHFFSVEADPITAPEDMKGLKIRVSNDPIMVSMVESLGATPSPVSMSEVYSSMQNGTIDGAEQPTANYKSNSFQEVGPNLTLDGHTLGAMETIITDEAWDELTENQQEVITAAGAIASEYCREVSEAKENAVLEQLIADGINVIEVADKTAWQEACQPITDKYATGDLADLYQEILDMAK